MASPGRTPREVALASVPQEWREALLQRAADAGITHSDDVAWVLVSAVVDAIAAAAAAGEAATTMANLFKTLPEAIQAGATNAGTDLQKQVLVAGEAIEKRLWTVAANTGEKVTAVQERCVKQAVENLRTNLAKEIQSVTNEVHGARTVGAELLQLMGILLVAASATWIGLAIGNGALPRTSGYMGWLHRVLEMPIGYVLTPFTGWGTYRLLSDVHPAIQLAATAFLIALTLLITFSVF